MPRQKRPTRPPHPRAKGGVGLVAVELLAENQVTVVMEIKVVLEVIQEQTMPQAEQKIMDQV